MDRVRVGIAGAGYAARFHLDCYKRVHSVPVEVIGVTSLTEKKRNDLASKYRIRSFATVEEMIGEVDVVDVCVPPYAHEKVALEALKGGCHVIIEKPLTGYFGDGAPDFHGNRSSKVTMLKNAVASADRIVKASERSGKKAMYAENWIYAPSIQKELEILRASKGQILWMIGEESHSGSHSDSYGIWSKSGGGSLLGKGCHPLTAVLYLKSEEGIRRDGIPITADSVNANVHEITRLPSFRDEGYLRTSYTDVEDYAQLHLTFSDGTVSDIFSSELVLGGTHSWLEVFANNHRTRCRISPVEALSTYNPKEELLSDVYVVEKIGTKQGWNNPSPDEWWLNGYYQEMQDFMECTYHGRDPQSDIELARDCVKVMYAAYVSAEKDGKKIKIP